MMPPVVPLVLWTSTLLAASSLLAVTSNSTDLGTSAKHRVYNACTIIPNGTYYGSILAVNTSAEWHLYDYCYFYHINLQTRVTGTALKENRCCRVCCNVTVSLGRIGRHYLFDEKAPFGFPCGPDKICDRDQACIEKPNDTIEIEKTTARKRDILVKETFWYSVHS
uniref:Putative salivary secreted peptide n=1 Tax=Ixodes ricinus TaxID=34613 RepID=A0A6B0UZ83_IXORI